MRDLKFRGWNGRRWLFGSLINYPAGPSIFVHVYALEGKERPK